MRVVKHWVKEPVAYLIPISDVHLGSKDFDDESEKKLRGYVNWVKERSNARITLIGDILNCATKETKGSPFDQKLDLQDQIKLACKLFEPVKKKIIAVSEGWHETVLQNYAGYSPTITICEKLGLEYLGNSGVIILGVGIHRGRLDRKNFSSPNVTYSIYQHHTTGGGATPGGKINRVDKLRMLVANADLYLGGHNHALGVMTPEIYVINPNAATIEVQRQHLVDTGGYVQWSESYAERLELPPFKRGSPRIRFDSKNRKKDIHVNI